MKQTRMGHTIILKRQLDSGAVEYLLTYDARSSETYRLELKKYFATVFEQDSPITFHEWHQTVKTTEYTILVSYESFLNNIIKKVHNQTVLPPKNVCYCNDQCKLSFISSTIYDDEKSLWDIEFSQQGDPCIVLNSAKLNSVVIEHIICYFIQCITNYLVKPDVACCPISIQFIKDMENFIVITKSVCFDSLKMYLSDAKQTYV